MKKTFIIAIAVVLVLGIGIGAYVYTNGAKGPAPTMVTADGIVKPAHVNNFRLHDHLGQSHELSRYMDYPGVVLLTHQVKGEGAADAWETFADARDTYRERGFAFFLLSSNSFDSLEEIIDDTQGMGVDVPVLRDVDQLVSDDLGVDRTNEAIVIVPASGDIPYRGSVKGLAAALGAIADGAEPPVYAEAPHGSMIPLSTPIVTPAYATEIAPIVGAKCAGCHVDGGVAPFAFDSHRKLSGWAPMVRETLLTKRMPPWHADPAHGEWAGGVQLTDEERQALVAWIDAGAPRGDAKEDPLRVVKEALAPKEWSLGEPDMIVEFAEAIPVPADGAVDYVYVEVPLTLTSDRWVGAAEIQPGAVEVVHHALAFVRYPDKYAYLQPEELDAGAGQFQGFAPGTAQEPFPEGTGKFLPRGSSIIFQMHYTAVGKAMEDRTRMGLHFLDSTPDHELETRALFTEDFAIPARAANYEASASSIVERDIILYSVLPHMHYRGSWFNYTAKYPDGTSEILLSVPYYDFNWQRNYEFAEPKLIPGGTEIVVTGAFDNSPLNPYNPDPDRIVRWGDQSWEEMFIGYMQCAEVEGNRAMRQIAMRR